MKLSKITGKCIPLEGDDIDTDRIIPARYLKEITFDNMGKYAFYDERFSSDGSLKDHPFNDPKFREGSILIVNKNFGCGSSREHAPQALMRYGIKAIIGESFAEIFNGNCISLGIPVATASHENINKLMNYIKENFNEELTFDLEKDKLTVNDFEININQKAGDKHALTQGLWDTTEIMRNNKAKIEEKVKELPYIVWN